MTRMLLVYPEFPPSYWSAKYALSFIGKKAAMPPLGLLTIAALFPEEDEIKVVDMNVEPLTAEHLEWAEYVFLSAMIVQRQSFEEVVARCNTLGKIIIAGGPFPSLFYQEISGVNHILRGEVDNTLPKFLEQLKAGKAPTVSPTSTKALVKPDISKVPVPRYDLINLNHYGSVSLQFSRGCPFDCEFCDITQIYGRVPRTKDGDQLLEEIDTLYECGWRGSIFLVDDNFIGNKRSVKELLPKLISWQKEHGYPFAFYTEASVNLADMPDLMDGMAEAGFEMVFLGLETPDPEVLRRTNKGQNVREGHPSYLLDAVRKIQHHGMEVSAGFIIGLDGESTNGFDAQIDFIQKAGIPTAMIGLLTALKGTRLYHRLKGEGRLLRESSGNNVSAALNFIPEMPQDVLLAGYKRVLNHLYDPALRSYFERCYTLIKNWKRKPLWTRKISKTEINAFLRTLWHQLLSRQGWSYGKFLLQVIGKHPALLPEAIRLAIMGYHYEKVTRQQIAVDDFKSFLEEERLKLERFLRQLKLAKTKQIGEAREYLLERSLLLQRRYREIHEDFRANAIEALEGFENSLRAQIEQCAQMLQIDEPLFVTI